MAPRSELQAIFQGLCPNVYFQPPSNVQMAYPAIVYHRDDMDIKYADNKSYSVTKKYEVKVIARDPDTVLVEQLAALPMSSYDRFFVADNLNHDVFTIYF